LQYKWEKITSSAYLTLLEINFTEFPVNPKKLHSKEIIISSYQFYAKATETTVEQVSLGYELEDAFLLNGLREKVKIILYNENKNSARLQHTLWHEIGHIKLAHNHEQEEKEEIEAHFFAAQINAPNIILKSIANRGYLINENLLIKYFGLSKESAEKKMNYLRKYNFEHTNEHDEAVILQFSDFLNTTFPVKSQSYYDDDEELERQRNTW